jgi:hypothetical protein
MAWGRGLFFMGFILILLNNFDEKDAPTYFYLKKIGSGLLKYPSLQTFLKYNFSN